MRTLMKLMAASAAMLLASCSVHEWPELPETVQFHLRLNYESEMTTQEYSYNEGVITDEGESLTYDNQLERGENRYIIRAYPLTEKQRATNYIKEFVITKDIAEGYDHGVNLELPAGSYNIMVWSDLTPVAGGPYYHNADDFAEISLMPEHSGNTDYRDAFRGMGEVVLVSDIIDDAPDTLDITMQRPLAKYEIVSTDSQEFIDKELDYLASVNGPNKAPSQINTQDYTVVLLYTGYMPDTYNMYADKPIDSYMGVTIQTKLKELNSSEASLGFDYVLMGTTPSSIQVQIGLFDKDQRQVALSNSINVPLNRSKHTVVRGSFLMTQSSGGIEIDPEFNGDHNIVID